MTAFYSTQVTKLRQTPRAEVKPNEIGGRVRVAYFDFTVPAGGVDIDDTVELTKIPAGARLLGGKLVSEAMSSGGAAASIQLGDGTTATKYLGTTSIDAAAQADFAHTAALNYGEELSAELTLTATAVTEAWVAAAVLRGHVLYVTD